MKNVLRTIEETEGEGLADTVKKLFLLPDPLARYLKLTVYNDCIILIQLHVHCTEASWPHGTVNVLTYRSSSLGSSPGGGHCVVFLEFPSNSLHPGV